MSRERLRLRKNLVKEDQLLLLGFPGGYRLQCRGCRRHSLDPWVGKIPLEEGMATHSMEYSFLESPMDRGAWQAAVRGVTRSRTGLA